MNGMKLMNEREFMSAVNWMSQKNTLELISNICKKIREWEKKSFANYNYDDEDDDDAETNLLSIFISFVTNICYGVDCEKKKISFDYFKERKKLCQM